MNLIWNPLSAICNQNASGPIQTPAHLGAHAKVSVLPSRDRLINFPIEDLLLVSQQRSQPDVLFRFSVVFAPVVTPTSLGGSDPDPARCPGPAPTSSVFPKIPKTLRIISLDLPNIGEAKKRAISYTLIIVIRPEHAEQKWIDISALEGETE